MGWTWVVVLFLLLFWLTDAHKTPLSTPQQIHLVFGGKESEYVISWVTFEPLSAKHSSQVRYGLSNTSLTLSATGTPKIFIEDKCFTQRLMHNVLLQNLQPSSHIFYQVSSDGVIWSSVYDFTVFPRNDKKRPMTISLVGDMGVPPTCNISSLDQWIRDTAEGKHDYVIHFGDIAYNLDDNCNQVGDWFMNQAQGVGAYTSYVYGVGNHETDLLYTYHSFLNRFAGQEPLAAASGSKSVRWLSFDAQLVHFVLFDTDAWVYSPVYPLTIPQLEWLRADLASVNRTSTPWIIVLGHRSMYCTKNTDPECNAEAEAIRIGLTLENHTFVGGIEALLLEYGADLYFGGHTHHYMRTWPVKNHVGTQKNYINPEAPIHIQAGIGGVDGEDAFELPMKDYDAWRDEKYYRSFSRLVVHNATHLSLSQHNAADGSVFDHFLVVQERHGPFSLSSGTKITLA